MSLSGDDTPAAASETTNDTDMLEDAASPSTNSSSPPPSTDSEAAAVSAVVSEAALLTTSATAVPPTLDDIDSSNTVPPAEVSKPSIATVTAIVNEVLRQKESGSGGTVDIASIASKEVDKFYEEEGKDEVYEEYNRRLPTAARKLHPWEKGWDETKALFGGKRRQNKRGKRSAQRPMYQDFDPESPDFYDICEDLGIDYETHPHLRSPYRVVPPLRVILRSKYFQYFAIVTCLVVTAVGITVSVTKAWEHAQKRNHELHPYWIKEETSVREDGGGEKDQGQWPGKDDAKLDYLSNKKKLSLEELDKLYYSYSDAYLPMWFDRESGWKGTTYQEALDFCRSHDDFVPCPYDVYCPGEGGRLIFNEIFEETEQSWAPIIDAWNEWVQVGNGSRQCTTFSGIFHTRPGWGLTDHGVNDEVRKITQHVMCCLENPLGDDFKGYTIPTPPDVAKENGEGIDDPIPPPPPPPQTNIEEEESPKTGPSFGSQTSLQLSPLHEQIRDSYRPFWFDSNDGWKGTTYEAAIDFCQSIPTGHAENFHLCPVKVYCPDGFDAPNPLLFQMEPFDGYQWAPVSNNYNSWVQVGQANEKDHVPICETFLSRNHIQPEWGLDGSSPELKKHILCCQLFSPPDGGSVKGNDEQAGAPASQSQVHGLSNANMPINQINPTEHSGADESEPHAAGEHKFDDPITAMKKTLNPVWYGHEDGWASGSHDDAIVFCNTKDQQLCPFAAYCPSGPNSPVLKGHGAAGDMSDQWAPTINKPNQWVLIKWPEKDDKSDECVTSEPSWGLDGSSYEKKNHVMCCKKTSSVSAAPVQQQQNQPQHDAAETQTNALASQTSEEASIAEDIITSTSKTGNWFHVKTGWTSGSHDDAIVFCNHHGGMELCPYHEYCPEGPSRPPVDGRGNIGELDEDSQQWAPTSNGDNQWVMVGMHGNNKATQCLTHGQLHGKAPLWGLDQSNQEQKHYVMCCYTAE